MTPPSTEDRAFIVEYAASLGPLLSTEGLPPRMRTALTSIYQRGLAYARDASEIDRDFVYDADDRLRELSRVHGHELSDQGRRAVLRGIEVAAAVRAAADPPAPLDAAEAFAVIEQAMAAADGVSVEVYRARETEDVERWRTRLPVAVVGVDTDTPTLVGVEALTAVQLRHLARDLQAKADAKTPPPATPAPKPQRPTLPARVTAPDMAGPAWTGGMVA